MPRGVQLHNVIEFRRVISQDRTGQNLTVVDPLSTEHRIRTAKYVLGTQGGGQEYIVVEIHKALTEPLNPPHHAFDGKRVECRQNGLEPKEDFRMKRKPYLGP